jgi:acetylornithine/N-succinyldiaminopimelate aminotransferase
MLTPDAPVLPWQQRWERTMMANYSTPPVLLVRGQGSRVWDREGREYIDLIAGIAVNAIGHAHPRMIEAINGQLATLGHTSNLYATLPALELAERLLDLAGAPEGSRVFFCNSGAEANEAAFKLTRLTGRQEVVVADNGFHGRTMGSLALTAQPKKQDPFRPLPGNVRMVEYGNADALAAVMGPSTAAVVLEPIQGEGGVIVPPDEYLRFARQCCDRVGSLLILDEVQTGIGRTGTWFCFQSQMDTCTIDQPWSGPDALTLAKGLGGGLPIGALIAVGGAAELFTPGSHGSTFGGNPVAAAAAHAVLDVIAEEDLLSRAASLHARLAKDLIDSSAGLARSVRGRGLLIAVELDGNVAGDLERQARQHGLLVNAVTPQAIRLAPALNISDEEIAAAMTRWSAACVEVLRTRVPA